ncbi:MAG: DVUA0089 family protein [Planctomycetota bacterium]|nr:DVUA0089 family protein [Planctomycetota bacterium]
MLQTTPRTRFTTLTTLGLGLVISLSPQLIATTTVGPDWDGDSTEDAGSVPATAQKVKKDDSNAVMVIRGELKGENGQDGGDEGLASVGDYQDMYQIVIMNPGLFEISTLSPLGFTEFDSMLSVYDAQGRALLANRNADQGTDASRVGNSSSNGEFMITTPGVVYIAISGSENRPVNAFGDGVFAWTPDPTDVVGPAFPAGQDPIVNWNGEVATGQYAIQLRASGPVPSGCAVENTESCTTPHPTPFCNDVSCCERVCTEDPFCCEVTWDGSCVEHALTLCNSAACNPNCPADLDHDGSINGGDLAMILAEWGRSGCTDLDRDGTTNGKDLAMLLSTWGMGCGTAE